MFPQAVVNYSELSPSVKSLMLEYKKEWDEEELKRREELLAAKKDDKPPATKTIGNIFSNREFLEGIKTGREAGD